MVLPFEGAGGNLINILKFEGTARGSGTGVRAVPLRIIRRRRKSSKTIISAEAKRNLPSRQVDAGPQGRRPRDRPAT